MSFPLYRELGRKKASQRLVSMTMAVLNLIALGMSERKRVFCYNQLTAEKVRHGAEVLSLHQPESVIIYNCVLDLNSSTVSSN